MIVMECTLWLWCSTCTPRYTWMVLRFSTNSCANLTFGFALERKSDSTRRSVHNECSCA